MLPVFFGYNMLNFMEMRSLGVIRLLVHFILFQLLSKTKFYYHETKADGEGGGDYNDNDDDDDRPNV
jgi:hypothetical protein